MERTQLALEMVKVIATMTAAGVAAWVAYKIGSSQRDIAARQANTAEAQKEIHEAKLKLDLFEERYEVFNALWTYLSRIKIDGPMAAQPPDIGNLIPKARFLFGPNIANYMEQAYHKHVELGTLHVQMEGGNANEEERAGAVKLEEWFAHEAKTCHRHFGDYLDFSGWKDSHINRAIRSHRY